jgi:HK97 family phage major capsid protein
VKSIIELREKRANQWEQAKALHDKSVQEGRDLNAEEQVQYDRIMADMDALTKTIEREERHLEMQKQFEKGDGSAATKPPVGEQRGGEDMQKEKREAFRQFLIGGEGSLTPEQRNLMAESRALSASTGSAGGYTVPQGFYNDLIQALKTFGGMRSVARVISTAGGNPLPIPTTNDTSNVGAILAENTGAGTQDVAFNQVTLNAYKYTSNIILIPIELIQDSAFDIESYVAQALATRIARITNTHFTVGTGSSQPQGVITGATVGKTGTTGQTTTVIYDDLVDLIHSVDISYRGNARFMMHDSSVKAIKKLKDSQGRPLWVPGVALNEPDTILGYGYTVNNDVPAMAISAKSIAFGDFSNYFIRDVMDVSVVRFSEKYMDAGQIGFVAFSRHDGKYVNAGTNPIALYQNSAS